MIDIAMNWITAEWGIALYIVACWVGVGRSLFVLAHRGPMNAGIVLALIIVSPILWIVHIIQIIAYIFFAVVDGI